MKFLKLNRVKRIIILGVTIIASLLTIILGSHYYVKDNARLSIEYGGGAEYLVKIKPDSSNPTDAKSIASSVADELYERINPTGNNGATVEPEIGDTDASVRVTYADLKNEDERKRIESLITSKPQFVFTDVYGNPLFDRNGRFRSSELSGQHTLVPSSISYFTDPATDRNHQNSIVPIVSSKASYVNNEWKVGININPSKAAEWTNATRYVASLPKGQNQIVSWLDIDKFTTRVQNEYPQFWQEGKGSPVLAAYVGGKPNGILRSNTIDASKYLISRASVKQSLSGNSFVIEGRFTKNEADSLARKINYGAAHYKLEKIYSNYVKATYGTNAFHKAIIAGLIVFILIAVFLVANYGLLGALSTISIALYVFITLSLFTVMRGEYSPETIAALIIGIGMAVDANIITFERLKAEVYSGSSIKKASRDSNKKSLSTIFDANITTLIVAFILFFFGTRNIVGLSVTLILSIMLTLVVMLGFTRFMSTMLVNTGMFENRKAWLGIHPKFDNKMQNTINKFDYIKSSKWFTIASAGIMAIGLIVMSVTAGIAGTISGGFNLSQEFTGGTVIQISSPEKYGVKIASGYESRIIDELHRAGAADEDIEKIYDADHDLISVKVMTKKDLDITSIQNGIKGVNNRLNVYSSSTTSDVAKKVLNDAMIAIAVAIAAIVAYTLIRFRWTYSFAAIVALVHDGLIVTAVFVIARVEISPVFIAGLLSIIGYSINDTIVTFDRIRENMNNHIGDLNKESIKKIANQSIKDTLKRSLLTSITTIVAVIVLMSFGNATKLSFNIAMLVGLVAGTYSSIFIATYLWTKLEWARQVGINKRSNNSFWTTKGVEEQTFVGINDYKA